MVKNPTLIVVLVLVLAVVAMTGYEIINSPDSDIAKSMSGALLLAFGSAITFLFHQEGQKP